MSPVPRVTYLSSSVCIYHADNRGSEDTCCSRSSTDRFASSFSTRRVHPHSSHRQRLRGHRFRRLLRKCCGPRSCDAWDTRRTGPAAAAVAAALRPSRCEMWYLLPERRGENRLATGGTTSLQRSQGGTNSSRVVAIKCVVLGELASTLTLSTWNTLLVL